MNKLNFLQPDKNNLNTYLYTGVILVALSIFIVFLNSFFNKDIISFLPGSISFFLPLILELDLELVLWMLRLPFDLCLRLAHPLLHIQQ